LREGQPLLPGELDQRAQAQRTFQVAVKIHPWERAQNL
jgi:hypothetical protein